MVYLFSFSSALQSQSIIRPCVFSVYQHLHLFSQFNLFHLHFPLACVAGLSGEGEGKQERGRRGTGARDEGAPATKTPIFSFLRPPAAAKF